MNVVIEVIYTCIAWDNHQGGSGAIREDRFFFDVDESDSVVEIMDRVFDTVDGIASNSYVGEVKVKEIKMINVMEEIKIKCKDK